MTSPFLAPATDTPNEAKATAPTTATKRFDVSSGLEASGRLVGPPVFKTGVGARAPRRVRFPSASATYIYVISAHRRETMPSRSGVPTGHAGAARLPRTDLTSAYRWYLDTHGMRVATRLTRDERKAQTRERLIGQAHQVFLRRGFHVATLEEIAAEAGVTKGAVYSNFESKADLFMAVLDARKRVRLDLFERVRSSASSMEDSARAHVRVILDDDPDGRWASALVEAWAASEGDKAFRARLAAVSEDINGKVGELIAEIAARGDLELPYPAERIAQIGAAVARGLLLQRLHDPRPLSNAEIEEAFVAFARGTARPRAGSPQREEP
jgi:AcrR family transcriptional regulator